MAIQSDYDTAWKEAIDIYFEDFMEFFFPRAHNQIDWQRGYENLETELQEIVRDAETGRRFADKLKKVWLENGQETWLLIHIEIQSQVKTNFAKRMYVYNHRLFDRYDRQVISFAILGDDSPSWRPKSYKYSRWGFKTWIKFPTVKLLDYEANWEALEKSHNPFAVVVMGHLSAMTTSDRPLDRFDSKRKIVRLLFERGYTKKEIYDLLRFLNLLMVLPPELEQNFKTEQRQIENPNSPWFQIEPSPQPPRPASEQPLEEAISQIGVMVGEELRARERARSSVVAVLEVRFGEVPGETSDRIYQFTNLDVLKELLKKAAVVENLPEFDRVLTETERIHLNFE